jgi:hypothetical protein
MKRIAQYLASLRLTLGGFALLALGTLATHDRPEAPAAAIVAPLALLALNLAAAIAVRPALRRGGLGLFHVALLALLLLIGVGRLTHFDARVEVTEDTLLDPGQIEVTGRGPWHGTGWQRLQFRQGAYEVDYGARVKRSHTRSQVWLEGENGAPRVVGDDTPLVLDGYRFYTTHNKGFAPLLTWQPDGGEPVRGALHMPSYPLFDYLQENRWTAPDGRVLRFWLRIERRLPEQSAWTLDPHDVPAVLVVEVDEKRHELNPGESVPLTGATLRYERLTGWMGYRIFYDPTLMPMLIVSLLGVLGLGWHLWGRGARLLPLREGVTA